MPSFADPDGTDRAVLRRRGQPLTIINLSMPQVRSLALTTSAYQLRWPAVQGNVTQDVVKGRTESSSGFLTNTLALYRPAGSALHCTLPFGP